MAEVLTRGAIEEWLKTDAAETFAREVTQATSGWRSVLAPTGPVVTTEVLLDSAARLLTHNDGLALAGAPTDAELRHPKNPAWLAPPVDEFGRRLVYLAAVHLWYLLPEAHSKAEQLIDRYFAGAAKHGPDWYLQKAFRYQRAALLWHQDAADYRVHKSGKPGTVRQPGGLRDPEIWGRWRLGGKNCVILAEYNSVAAIDSTQQPNATPDPPIWRSTEKDSGTGFSFDIYPEVTAPLEKIGRQLHWEDLGQSDPPDASSFPEHGVPASASQEVGILVSAPVVYTDVVQDWTDRCRGGQVLDRVQTATQIVHDVLRFLSSPEQFAELLVAIAPWSTRGAQAARPGLGASSTSDPSRTLIVHAAARLFPDRKVTTHDLSALGAANSKERKKCDRYAANAERILYSVAAVGLGLNPTVALATAIEFLDLHHRDQRNPDFSRALRDNDQSMNKIVWEVGRRFTPLFDQPEIEYEYKVPDVTRLTRSLLTPDADATRKDPFTNRSDLLRGNDEDRRLLSELLYSAARVVNGAKDGH